MVSNFSPKITKKYIGNKGLGFRSIVNWSNKITINTRNINISFSKKIAEAFFDEICDEQTQKKIINQRNLPKNVKPIAFLAVPDISEKNIHDWTTVITIDYKDIFFNDIMKQIENIKDEILLFVNHIDKIQISIDGQLKTIERIKDKNLIYVNNKLWTIYNNNDLLPNELWDKENEEENFELKIAIQENFDKNNNLLYSYFPTKIEIDFPFIIHGTFDLNTSRNDLNDNKKNRYVIEKLVELIIDTAKSLTKEEVSYKALEFLTHTNKNTTLSNLGFYEKIDDSFNNLAIFPCLDNTYRKKDEVIFISDALSDFIKKTNNQKIFPELLIPNNSPVNIHKFDLENSIDTNKLNFLSKNINSIEDRVELIYILYNKFKNKFVILVDRDNNLVGLDDVVYTPTTKDYEFNIPDYVKIKFINPELFDKLLLKFNINSNEKTRDLQRILKDITNIQSYEPAQVLQKIITTTNKKLATENVDKLKIIKKMVLSLFENYKILGIKTKIPENTKIQIINKDNKIINSKELFLSKSYPSGNLTEELFRNVYDKTNFLADVDKFNFDKDEDREQIEQFFLWLGVNKYTKFRKKDTDFQYDQFLLKKFEEPPSFSQFVFEMKSICDLEIIKKIPKENIILWVFQDNSIREELYNKHAVRYIKHRGYVKHHFSYDAPSYILYQLTLSKIFKDYLITNKKLSPIINEIPIDYNFELFKKYGIKRSEIDSIMIKIGAVEKFDKLSIDKVRHILEDLPQKSPDGKQVLTIYKDAVEHYKNNNQALNNNEILISARKDGKLGYYPQNVVFYNGNLKLPKKITDSKAIINYPRRQNTKNVVEFFGINDLKSISISIQEYIEAEILTKDFQNFFNNILPYILAYRFEESTTEISRKKDLSSIRNTHIILCNQVRYKIDDEIFELEENDYIKDVKQYYIKIETTKSFEQLRKKLDFRETFADIISTVFDIIDTDKYSRLISDDIKETEEIIKRNIGYDAIVRARELLGISDEYYSFWKTIYSLKGIDYLYNSDNSDKILLQKIKKELGIKTEIQNIDYNDLQSFKSCELIAKLFNELNIDIDNFNRSSISFYKLDFRSYHENKLKFSFNDSFYHFKQLLYNWCITSSQEKEFLNLIGLYEHNEEVIDENSIKVNYQSIVKKYVIENFGFNLDVQLFKEVNVEKIYEDNKKKIDFEKIESSNEYRSLLYFENKIEEIEKYIKSEKEKKQSFDVQNNRNKVIKSIVHADLSIPSYKNQHKREKQKTSKKPFKHSQQKNIQDKAIGDRAEQEVFDSLVNEFGEKNVEWTSKNDDKLGYDIRYRNKENKWKNVEVKTYSNGLFHLTKKEKEFADKNKESYEIYLVGEKIYKLSEIDFSNSDKFILVTNEYEVYYRINA